MEAIKLLSRYNTADALAFTQKRLDAALMGMQTLKGELKHAQEMLKKERHKNIGLTRRYNNLYKKHQQYLSGGKVTRKYRQEAIRDAVCRYFGIPEIKPVGGSRAERERYPRQVYIYLTYTMTTATFEALAVELNADHTTCIAARDRVRQRIDANAPYDPVREDIENIKAILSGESRTCQYRSPDVPSRGKAVQKIDAKGNVLAEYPTLCIAQRECGMSYTTLQDIISGVIKKSKYGLWRFKQD